jgi:hypothetical protein
MDRVRLVQLVQEFVVLAVDAVPTTTDESYTKEEMLALWGADEYCMLSTMFLGYCMGEGEDINAFTPQAMHLAVLSAADGVEFDWIGDCDVTSKPH